MPELPEVETVCRGIAPDITGKKIVSVAQNRPNLRYPFPEGFVERLEQQSVLSVGRRSKYIMLHVSNDQCLVIHLGMSGTIEIVRSGRPYEARKHDHFSFDFDDGTRLIYNDPRRFGFALLFDEDAVEQDRHFKALGPEPFSNHFHAQYLYERAQASRSPVKTILLNQNVVAGLGNIYVCEVLYRCGIHPCRLGTDLTLSDCEKLVPAIRDVLNAAIESGGSSLRDYRQADGKLGYFQHSFQVYGREGDVCGDPDCACVKQGGVQRIVQSGRSSFFCPIKQGMG